MSDLLFNYLKNETLGPAISEKEAGQLSKDVLEGVANFKVYPRSIVAACKTLYFLGRREKAKLLGLISESPQSGEVFDGHQEKTSIAGKEVYVTVAPAQQENAALLREALPFLTPQLLGTKKSAGCGDRLALATPGHIRAIRKSSLAPIFAQQSVRENERTGRTPQQVLDDAMWGVFQEGWREGYGADADHLKTTADIDAFASAGYTFFTIDPGEHVDDGANTASPEVLGEKFENLPWQKLEYKPEDLINAMAERVYHLDDISASVSRADLIRAAVKYGKVVAHTLDMYRHLCRVMSEHPFEMEVSVDETESETTLTEHIYIASELKRLGVEWVSLAPRYVGDFEKGVDYIGDLEYFRDSFKRHAAVARTFGQYKLSLHSGSDKFSIYPIATELTGGLVHLKTAGTSYLEALRTISRFNPALFRKIVRFAIECYPQDRATYHVSALVDKMPGLDVTADEDLTEMLDNFDAREILHVTYGSVLNSPKLRETFFDELIRREEAYTQTVEAHFDKHFRAFE
jgi:hypothetical protein